MSKPIFIIRIPQVEAEQDRAYVIVQTMKVAKELDDYHVLPVIDSYTSEIKFECFNAPHTEMEFEELKRRVLELMK
jgi:hypothetical protein